MSANLGPDPRMGSLISDFKLGSQTHNGDGMEINARISKQSRKDTKMNSNPNQMQAHCSDAALASGDRARKCEKRK